MSSETYCLWLCDLSLLRKKQLCRCTVKTVWLLKKGAGDESPLTLITVEIDLSRKFKNTWTIYHSLIRKPVM